LYADYRVFAFVPSYAAVLCFVAAAFLPAACPRRYAYLLRRILLCTRLLYATSL
jgi:hypothetical protein